MSGKIRFAPSPTGYLHEGHLLSALYVWAAAKKWNLKVHLRIEDHDDELNLFDDSAMCAIAEIINEVETENE